jgi:hypothetical protein
LIFQGKATFMLKLVIEQNFKIIKQILFVYLQAFVIHELLLMDKH